MHKTVFAAVVVVYCDEQMNRFAKQKQKWTVRQNTVSQDGQNSARSQHSSKSIHN